MGGKIKKYPQKGIFVWLDANKKIRVIEKQKQIINNFKYLVRAKSKYKKASAGHSLILAIAGCLDILVLKKPMLKDSDEIKTLRTLLEEYKNVSKKV